MQNCNLMEIFCGHMDILLESTLAISLSMWLLLLRRSMNPKKQLGKCPLVKQNWKKQEKLRSKDVFKRKSIEFCHKNWSNSCRRNKRPLTMDSKKNRNQTSRLQQHPKQEKEDLRLILILRTETNLQKIVINDSLKTSFFMI